MYLGISFFSLLLFILKKAWYLKFMIAESVKVKKNILLVDDDSIAIFLLERIVQSTGLANTIYKALNGKEALSLLDHHFDSTNNIPEVILLDLNMPIMNGFEFLAAFNALDTKAKDNILIIVVTSSTNPEDIEKAREMGIRYFLTKPISAEIVKSIILDEFE